MGLFQDLLGGSRHSERLRTVEIEGFRPVTICSLSYRQLRDCERLASGNQDLELVHIIQRGMKEPKADDEFLAEIRETPDVLVAIAEAIIEASWPNVVMKGDPSPVEPRKQKLQPHASVELAFHPTIEHDYVGVSIVGESHYQDALREICGRKNDEQIKIESVATLVPEPGNPYDPNAVRVEIDGMQVGYLSRDDAPDFHRRVVRLLEEGGDPTVEAFVGAQGPEGENPNIGVQLHIPKDSPLQIPVS